jgi:hypothetical protein
MRSDKTILCVDEANIYTASIKILAILDNHCDTEKDEIAVLRYTEKLLKSNRGIKILDN